MTEEDVMTIVGICREREDGHKCGYCKSENTNFNDGMWATQMSVRDYQDLIDRGWRRSGQYCYKPCMQKMCCPMYTIRCNAVDFKISKSQKKIIKRMNRFVTHGERGKKSGGEPDEDSLNADDPAGSGIDIMERYPRSPLVSNIVGVVPLVALSMDSATSSETKDLGNENSGSEDEDMSVAGTSDLPVKEEAHADQDCLSRKTLKPGDGPDKDKPPCKKARLIRIARRQEKLATTGVSNPPKIPKENNAKSLEDFLSGDEHKLQVRFLQIRQADIRNTFRESFNLYRRYQMAIHGDPESKCSENQFRRFLCQSPLKLKLVSWDSPSFRFLDSWRLYEKYQKVVHKETEGDCDQETFMEFLVNTPLKIWKPKHGPPQGYGSFHMQYWVDDKLIAVGVIDILPRCVSSVYFYYDPDYSDLSLGTYGTLREVALTRALRKTCPDMQWYYMGFYIHSCPKMRYKAAFSPSYLLCPEAYTWHPIEKCIPLIEKSKYSRLDPDSEKSDPNFIEDVSKVLVLKEKYAVPYGHYLRIVQNEPEQHVLHYAKLVGKVLAERMVILPG